MQLNSCLEEKSGFAKRLKNAYLPLSTNLFFPKAREGALIILACIRFSLVLSFMPIS